MTQQGQVELTSRVFSLAAIFALALMSRDAAVVQGVIAVTAVAAMSVYLTLTVAPAGLWPVAGETLVVGLIMGLTFPHSSVLLPYLVVLPLLAGLSHRLVGATVIVSAEAVAIVLVPLMVAGFHDAPARVAALAPWLFTNLGAGFLGVWARKLGPANSPWNHDTHYESARQLLTQLRAVARRLSAGLDSEGMAAQMLVTVHEFLNDRHAAVFVNATGSMLTPLAYRGPAAQELLVPQDPLVDRCWAEMEPVQGAVPVTDNEARHRVILLLRVGHRMIGVAVAAGSQTVEPAVINRLMAEMDAQSLRLDTALVFAEIRTMATTDERQRLAREIHDGIAQEVASIGYVVDHLTAITDDPTMADGLRALRAELSRVVAELRLSIFDLRSDVSPTAGLGSALSEYVRQVGAKSDLTVHLTLNEAPTRLAPAVEGELFRIAQEAITNARKHASASNLWVDCWTDPPCAGLTVRDDGRGLSPARDDSYGMSIMRERAERIDATLDISNETGPNTRSGTIVRVRVAPKGALTTEGVRS